MYCPQCGAEYRPGITVCPDCNMDLRSEPVQKQELITIDLLPSLTLAAVAAHMLIFLFRFAGTVLPHIFENESLRLTMYALQLAAALTIAVFYIFLLKDFIHPLAPDLDTVGIVAVTAVLISMAGPVMLLINEFTVSAVSFPGGWLGLVFIQILSTLLMLVLFFMLQTHFPGGSLLKNIFLLAAWSLILDAVILTVSPVIYFIGKAGRAIIPQGSAGMLILLSLPLISLLLKIIYLIRFHTVVRDRAAAK